MPAPKMTAGSRIAAANIQDKGGMDAGNVPQGSFSLFF
jgi:hypothetical protein